MDLNEFTVGVPRAKLIAATGGASGAHDGVGALAKHQTATTGRHHDSIGAEGADLHRAKVLCNDPLADPVRIEDRTEKLPVLILRNPAFALESAHLLVKGVDELLPRGRAREVGALVERSAEEPKVALALKRAVEGDSHPVEQVDDLRRPVRHLIHRRLVREKVAAVDRFIKVLILRVALLTRDFIAGVDTALGANRVGTLDRDDREEVDRNASLGDAECGCKACESAANNDHATL